MARCPLIIAPYLAVNVMAATVNGVYFVAR